jgi:transposase
MTKRIYVGLDVGSSTCHLAALDTEGRSVRNLQFPTSEAKLLTAIADLPGEVQVHLEASELAGWIRGILTGRVARVVISHATTNAWIAKDPRKRDSVDAFKLAELLRLGRVHEVYYPDEAHRAVFKQLMQHYDDVVSQQVRLKLKLKARLRTQGVIVRGKAVYSSCGRTGVVAQVESLAARQVIEQLYALLDATIATQREALTLLRRHARQYPEIGRFQAVPGVGLIGAARFSAYIQTPHRFSSKRKLWRYCRLGITDRSSDGKRRGRQRLDRTGHGRLKDLARKAVIAALHMRTDNAFKRAYQQTLDRTHNALHARLTTQRKILAVLRALGKGGTEYQDDRV